MIDLHVHTTNSDSRLKVEEILEMAEKTRNNNNIIL